MFSLELESALDFDLMRPPPIGQLSIAREILEIINT